MQTYQLMVRHWAAFSPARKHTSEWFDWALDRPQVSVEGAGPYKPDLPGVPAMLRRRLSAMGKAALWCADHVLSANEGPEPVSSIFCSQHGEVSRTVALLKDLAEQSPMSPASFSLSVHNAIGGLYSIAGDVEHPVTAIAAGPDSPFSALLEAWSQLRFRQLKGERPGPVLCVIYDDALPAETADPAEQQGDVQALALLVSDTEASDFGEQVDDGRILSLALSDESGADSVELAGTAVDTMLKFLLNDGACRTSYQGDGRTWICSKHKVGAPRARS